MRRSTWLVILAWLVVGVAIWETATLFPFLNLDLTRDYLVLFALAGLSELVAAPLPFGRLSTGFAIVLAAQLVYGPAPAVWIWALATLAGQGIANRGNPLRTTIFNAAQFTLAAVVAARVSTLPFLITSAFVPRAAGQSLVFTVAYYLASLLLLGVFYLPPGRSRTSSYLRDALGWDLFTYLITWPFGLAMAVLYKSTGLAGLVLLFVPLWAVGWALRRFVRASLADRELTVLYEMAGRLSSVWEPAKAFRLVLAAAGKLVPFHSAMLFLWSEAEKCFRVEAVRSRNKGNLAGVKLFREQALPALMAKELKPVLIHDSRQEASLAREAGPAQFWRSLALFPLPIEGELAGILVLGDKKAGAFTEKHQESLTLTVTLATRIAAAVLLGRRLQEASATDTVTGLYNRRYFVLRTGEEGERSRRFGTEFAILLLALDTLAEVAERFGQGGAESLLVEAADLLARTVRPVDLAARYGDREVAVLMPEAGLKEAAWLAENLVQTFRTHEFPIGERTIVQLGFRVAWAVFPRQAQDVAGLFQRVELRLSQATEAGPAAPADQ